MEYQEREGGSGGGALGGIRGWSIGRDRGGALGEIRGWSNGRDQEVEHWEGLVGRDQKAR